MVFLSGMHTATLTHQGLSRNKEWMFICHSWHFWIPLIIKWLNQKLKVLNMLSDESDDLSAKVKEMLNVNAQSYSWLQSATAPTTIQLTFNFTCSFFIQFSWPYHKNEISVCFSRLSKYYPTLKPMQ